MTAAVHRIRPASDTQAERLRIIINKRLSQLQIVHAFKENDHKTLLEARGGINALRAVLLDLDRMERT